ncbi:aldolase/citrate lyase family protein [Paracoccus sp. pheM1]|uniref:HpcH/HpaI aldolase family protein n=1 Tax=Paracoccus sp. pheM1 TaxID=2831675 RepID=UPI001F0A5852|nr:aldolase/citrate lyase family protein [Paracoccus sp. pheM1]
MSAQPDMRRNILRDMVAQGRTIVNAWLSIPSSYSAEGMGHTGVHAVTVDMQHGMLGRTEALHMLQAISGTPAIPLVRVPALDGPTLMHVLDCGAYGVICPMISTAEEAAALVRACRYPPHGNRSFGPSRGLLYGGPDYVRRADAEIMVIPMIETAEAVENIDAILAVPGIDMIYVGPNDLAFALDGAVGTDRSRSESAIAQVLDRAKAAGIPAGIFCADGADAARRAAQGFALVTPGNDFGTLTRAMRAAVAEALDRPGAVPIASGGY